MTDIFMKEDVNKLFRNKHVVFMGDSNIRALYKDLLCLSQKSQFITQANLKNKMENSVYGDKLVFHGRKYNGRDYREEREMCIKGATLSYFFLTRVYDEYVEAVIRHITSLPNKPDVIIVNSCLWDVTRWGPHGIEKYKSNLITLMKQFQKYLPKDCLVIWSTTPPISSEMRGGFLVKELQFLKYSLRFHIFESNYYARKIVVAHGYDVLDFHYHLRMQLFRREHDGVHWSPEAVRYLLNLLLTHISLAWGEPLPHRYDSVVTKRTLEFEDKNDSEVAKQGEQKLTLQSVVVAVNNAGEANVKNKEIVTALEQNPSAKKMKHVPISFPSPSTPRRSTPRKLEKENSSVITRKKKRGRIQGSCGAFMKKWQNEQRSKKKGRHQSNYVNNFNPHVSIPPFNSPQVPMFPSPSFNSPRSPLLPHPYLRSPNPLTNGRVGASTQHMRIASLNLSPKFSMLSSPSFFSPCRPVINPNSHLSPCRPVINPNSHLSPYSPSQPLKSYVNSPFYHAQSCRTPPNSFMKRQEVFRNDVVSFSPSYYSFE